jgi:YD repeat-containing protein
MGGKTPDRPSGRASVSPCRTLADAASTVTRRQEYTYFESRRLKTVKDPVSAQSTQYTVDERGLVTQVDFPSSLGKTGKVYDPQGRQTQRKDYLDATNYDAWDFVYASLRKPTSITDEDAKANAPTYDDLGRRVRLVSPDSGTTLHLYDARGRVTTLIEAKGLAGEQKIDADPRGLDELMAALPPGREWLLLAPGVWIALVVALCAAALVAATRFGRHLVAVGSNERTARLCGVAVGRTKILVYTLSGALAGLAGAMELATLTVGDPTDSIGLELEVIAAVVIGGGSLSGGQGSVAGSLLGAALMTVIKSGCTHTGVPNWVQEILTGVIIVAAVTLDHLRQRARGED